MSITDLKDKNVLITGAGGGIGLATAEAFARRGARLFITDINAELLAGAQERIESLGVPCHANVCNVADAEAVSALARQVEADHGALHVLVNNAGIAFLGGFMEHGLEHWSRILQVNVMGVVHGIRAFLPAMRAAGDARHVVNIASTAAVAPAPNMSAYAASKGAVKMLGEVLAMELEGSNIVVHGVYPGLINTAIVSGAQSVGSNITPVQLATLQQYYVSKGCDPSVVAEDIVRGVLKGKPHIFTGPLARLGGWMARLSPWALRRLTIVDARKIGYLPAQ